MGNTRMRMAGMLACAGTALCVVFAAQAAAKAERDAKNDPTVTETMASVGQIAHELKQIDARLQSVEKSLASIDKSLAPIGAAIKPDGINIIVTRASETAYERVKSLILLATACLAGLIALHAVLRRWTVARAGH